MAHDAFISYAAQDKSTADAVVATLEANRIRCWIAPRDVLPGQDYAEALIEGISESRVMILVFSSNSNNSPHVMREVERATSKGIPILPLRIEDVPPSKSMEYFISRTHWLDALTPPLEQHLQQLAETVKMLLTRAGRPEQAGGPPEAPVSPPSAEAAVDKRLGRPAPLQEAFESVKGWVGRPMVRLGLGMGAIVTVAIIVLVALLSGGGDDSGPAALVPSPTESSPTSFAEQSSGPYTGPYTYSGQGDATTDVFCITESQFEVDWTVASNSPEFAFFSGFVFFEGESVIYETEFHLEDIGSGTSKILGPGCLYIEVLAANLSSWTATVTQ